MKLDKDLVALGKMLNGYVLSAYPEHSFLDNCSRGDYVKQLVDVSQIPRTTDRLNCDKILTLGSLYVVFQFFIKELQTSYIHAYGVNTADANLVRSEQLKQSMEFILSDTLKAIEMKPVMIELPVIRHERMKSYYLDRKTMSSLAYGFHSKTFKGSHR